MQFIVIAYDYPDNLEKRLKVRAEHVAIGDELKAKGHYLMGCALLNDQNEMCGSVMIMDFESEQVLQDWLKREPYVVHQVWKTWKIKPCRVGPTFLQK